MPHKLKTQIQEDIIRTAKRDRAKPFDRPFNDNIYLENRDCFVGNTEDYPALSLSLAKGRAEWSDDGDVFVVEEANSLSSGEASVILNDLVIAIQRQIEALIDARDLSGLSMVISLQYQRYIVTANIGEIESQLVLKKSADTFRLIPITCVHDLKDENEKNRLIYSHGNEVLEDIRDVTTVTRALGFKNNVQRGIIHSPTITRYHLPDDVSEAYIMHYSPGVHSVMNLADMEIFFNENYFQLPEMTSNILQAAYQRNSDSSLSAALIPVHCKDKMIISYLLHPHVDNSLVEPVKNFIYEELGRQLQPVHHLPPHTILSPSHLVDASPENKLERMVDAIPVHDISDNHKILKSNAKKFALMFKDPLAKEDLFFQPEQILPMISTTLGAHASPRSKMNAETQYRQCEKLSPAFQSRKRIVLKIAMAVLISVTCIAAASLLFATALFFMGGGPANPVSYPMALLGVFKGASVGLALAATLTTYLSGGVAASCSLGLFFRRQLKHHVRPTVLDNIMHNCREIISHS